jgi:hypothetical protein
VSPLDLFFWVCFSRFSDGLVEHLEPIPAPREPCCGGVKARPLCAREARSNREVQIDFIEHAMLT